VASEIRANLKAALQIDEMQAAKDSGGSTR